MMEFIYILKLIPRLLTAENWTESDNNLVKEHFQRLLNLKHENKLILAGKTDNLDETTFGIVILQVENEQAARTIMENDPTVKSGIMTAELYPYSVAIYNEKFKVEGAAGSINHKQLASQYFNQVWDLLDLSERTKEQEENMIHLAHTSFWHWTQVPDHTATNLSIGYWQISRVYAVAKNGERAKYYAERCIEVSEDSNIPPFYIGYGYEALVRACVVLEQYEEAEKAYNLAQNYVEKIVIEDSKKMLVKDLEELKIG
ncbi:YciI family protein [Pseudoneobacillus sp. C159]